VRANCAGLLVHFPGSGPTPDPDPLTERRRPRRQQLKFPTLPSSATTRTGAVPRSVTLRVDCVIDVAFNSVETLHAYANGLHPALLLTSFSGAHGELAPIRLPSPN
jgi:hypothetical protein